MDFCGCRIQEFFTAAVSEFSIVSFGAIDGSKIRAGPAGYPLRTIYGLLVIYREFKPDALSGYSA
jgi:hypothetical protein